MARQSATSPCIPCKIFFIYLLMLSILPLIQCRPLVPKISRPEHDKPVLDGLRIDLVHRDSSLSPLFPGNITSTERVKRAAQRSQERLQTLHKSVVPKAAHAQLAHKSARIQAPVSPGSGEFTMEVGIGEPPLSYSGILDTGSDLIWTQCLPCDYCYNQSSPIYDPIQSQTFMTVPCDSAECHAKPNMFCSADLCNYKYEYGDESFSTGSLSIETFTFSSQSVDEILFGCGSDNEGHFGQAGGIVGFGRGHLSLISQLASLGGNKFSYCLTSFENYPSKSSPLMIGHTASFSGAPVSSTPFIQNSAASASLYYLTLHGISLGGALLMDIPDGMFDILDDGSGGFIIDSGTTFTYLYDDAYEVLKESLISSINLPQADGSDIGLDLCFNFPTSDFNFPTITFHFEGADYDVNSVNYMYVDTSGVICLAMLPSSNLSILGNYQQQNYQFLYDNGNNMLSFAPTVCDTL